MKGTHAPDLSIDSEFQKTGITDFAIPAFWKKRKR